MSRSLRRLAPRIALMLAGSLAWSTASAQAAPPDSTARIGAVRAFLDCREDGCDRDFLVTELAWVDWMRDRLDAEVHLLVTQQATGSGGAEWVVVAIGQRGYAGAADTLRFTTAPNDATDLIRRQLLRVVSQLLLPYAARGPLGTRLTVAYSAPPATSAASAPADDRWNFWTYGVSGNAFLNGESQQSFENVSGSLSANRTTEASKIRVSASNSYNRSTFTLSNGTTFEALQRNSGLRALAVRSQGEHWSTGVGLAAERSDFENTKLSAEARLAAEWDYFPYKEFARRKLAVLYSVGARSLRYREVTIYDRLRETRPIHALDVTYGARQPWGEANITLSGSQYLDALKYYNAGLFGDVEVRVGKGLSVNVGGNLTRVRDQLYLPRGGQSDAEVIARLQALQTNYRFSSYVGIRYQFGSIFNSVVNPRFGTMGGGGGGITIRM